MKLEKAIATLNDILTFVKPGDPPDEHDALRLGIEALKSVEAGRIRHPSWALFTLPGETS